MKETPILMSTDMIKATLEGRKVMTRRTYGLEKVNANPDEWEYRGILDSSPQWHIFRHIPTDTCLDIKCPYGQAGDLLWFKETWIVDAQFDGDKASEIPTDAEVWYKTSPPLPDSFNKWRSGRFMPKWACRIRREIKSIRAEKLQDIELVDIVDEGTLIPEKIYDLPDHKGKYLAIQQYFIDLWDSINGKKYPWSSNPWVWPIEFERK